MRRWLHILKRRNRFSFTLVEFLIVTTIISFVAVGIASSFLTGLRLWDRVKNTDFFKGDVLLTLEVFSRQLRQSINFNLIVFEGTKSEISFPSLVGNSILKITYKFEPNEKKFICRQSNLKDILAKQSENNYTEKTLFSIDDLIFEYFYFDKNKAIYTWKDNWSKEDGIFTAVKVHIITKNEEFTKTVFLPFS